MIPETFLSSGISTVNVVADNPVYHIDPDNLHNDNTVVVGSKTKTYHLNKVNTTLVYNDSSQTQMDSGTGVSVTNLVSLLHNGKYFNTKFKSCVRMYGATLKKIITPCAVGLMRVRVLTRQGYIDVKCHYSPHFSTILFSHFSVIEATGQPKHYIP